MQDTIRLRSKIAMATRTYLDTVHGNQQLASCIRIIIMKISGFVDIETPTLFKRTPEVRLNVIL